MCFGETSTDTLRPTEQALLQAHASDRLPDYRSTIRSNDAITWAVLEPRETSALPRFTICRIEPSIMVMVEDATRHRRFASAASVEDAVAFASQTVRDAALALRNVHGAPELAQ